VGLTKYISDVGTILTFQDSMIISRGYAGTASITIYLIKPVMTTTSSYKLVQRAEYEPIQIARNAINQVYLPVASAA
jgi:hypothetical protein